MRKIVWLATGLGPETSGIPRFCFELGQELIKSKLVDPADVCLVVDGEPSWAPDFGRIGFDVRARLSSTRLYANHTFASRARVVHNFGAAIFPRKCTPDTTFLMSVYDWGPFRDSGMRMRSRAAWAQAIIRGVRQADIVHYLNPYLGGQRPRSVPAPRREVVSYPSSRLATLPVDWMLPAPAKPGYALFVGTDVPRKRVAQIVAMAESTETRVHLIGSGTDAYVSMPNVVGEGRLDDSLLQSRIERSSTLMLVSEYEGFGIPILEAAVRGIHSVVSSEVYGSLPTAIRPWAHVVDPYDPIQFAHGVREASARRGSARFNGSELLSPLTNLYGSLLARP